MPNTLLDFAPPSEVPKLKRNDEVIAIIGLGYVGLPLAVAMATSFETVFGYDVSLSRIASLKAGIDHTKEISTEVLTRSTFSPTHQSHDLTGANCYIVAVPTPVTAFNQPDLTMLEAACTTVGRHLTPGDLVVFESTVFPGVTEDHCIPLLEEYSGLTHLQDFNVAYSPERINPGDKVHCLENIIKLIAADSRDALKRLQSIYAEIITAELYPCPSIRVAEAAKALENTQRDVNIALMNEMSALYERLGIETYDVLEAAKTKWNFLPFTPGLVGGHCISVDPHYLRAVSEREGLVPSVVENARRVNDAVRKRVMDRILRHASTLDHRMQIGQIGLTFKADVPDVRNSQALELAKELDAFGLKPLLDDPVLVAEGGFPIELCRSEHKCWRDLDVLIVAVPHGDIAGHLDLKKRVKSGGLLIDIQSAIPIENVPTSINRWSL